jgi:hypothetical protein
MDLVARAQAIILKPKDEWVKIKGETTSVTQLFMSYAAILALIPAVAQFIGYGLIGIRVPYVGMIRSGIGTALIRAIVYYVVQLAVVYAIGLIINALAPSFSSKQSQDSAMKLAVYSMTVGWIGGIFYIIPALGILAMLAGLYGLYVLYLGFATPMMETPKEKVLGYLIVCIVAVVVLMVVAGVIISAIFSVGRVPVGF